MTFNISKEIQYILLVFGLFIVPRVLQRFRIPSALTCVAIGVLLAMAFGVSHEDSTVTLLATLGIVSMFLFAGLEVDFSELRFGRRVLLQHLAVQLVVLAIVGLAIHVIFRLEVRAALLFALALLTPSTGFILDSLQTLGLQPEEQFWVKSKAIASELVALAVLFFTIQSSDARGLGISALVIVCMVALLPPIFRAFAHLLAPFAPNTEFTFLVIVALLCAYVTRELGVYYLVGAFIVGVTAVRMRRDLPELSSERLLGAVELFASFFIPFYFLKSGLHLEAREFTPRALVIGVVLVVVLLPFRVMYVMVHRRLALREAWQSGARIGVAVLPTLVFSIVIAGILKEQFHIGAELVGALMIYTGVNTLLPGLLMRTPAPEFDTPEAPRFRPSASPPPAEPES